jgi:hypothetical protein
LSREEGSQRMTWVAFCARYEIMSWETGMVMKWSRAAWLCMVRVDEDMAGDVWCVLSGGRVEIYCLDPKGKAVVVVKPGWTGPIERGRAELSRARRRLLELWVSRVRGGGSVAVVTKGRRGRDKGSEYYGEFYGRRKTGEMELISRAEE